MIFSMKLQVKLLFNGTSALTGPNEILRQKAG